MSTPSIVRFDRPSLPVFGNGLGLLLHEQRRLRQAQPRQASDRALSPFASLRGRGLHSGDWTGRSSPGGARPSMTGGLATMDSRGGDTLTRTLSTINSRHALLRRARPMLTRQTRPARPQK